MPKKKKLAIALCSTVNQIFAVGNVLIGLKKHFSLPESEYDIILYVNKDMDKRDEKALKSIYNNIVINNYKSPLSKSFKNANCALMWSLMTFARYECFSLLKEYDKILYLDTDTLVKKDIMALIDIEKEMSVCFEGTLLRGNIENKLLAGRFNSMKYNLDTKVFNAGVFLINEKLRNGDKIKEWCYKKSEEWLMTDQPIINLAAQEFNIELYDFSDKYNRYPFAEKGIDDAVIVHTAWGKKFWNGYDNEEWNENNKKWLELGGSQYDAKYIENKIKEINKIAWWIPNKKLRDIYRVRMGEKYGFRWQLY